MLFILSHSNHHPICRCSKKDPFDNFKICAILESGSHACFVFSDLRFFKKQICFVSLWLRWAWLLWGLFLAVASRATVHLGARAPYCSGSSCCGAQALGRVGFSSCGVCGMWELPGPGIEPMSPALAGGSPSAAPPGTSRQRFLKCLLYVLLFLVGARHVLGNRK